MSAENDLQYYSYDLACSVFAMNNNIICSSKDEFAKKIEGIAVQHALAAAHKAIMTSFVPTIGGFFSDNICLKAIRPMCGEICESCGIGCNNDISKTFGSSIKARVKLKLLPIFAQGLFLAPLSGYTNFLMVYLSGIVCIKVINDIIDHGTNINEMAKADFDNAVYTASSDIKIKQVLSQTKSIFKQESKNNQIADFGKDIDL